MRILCAVAAGLVMWSCGSDGNDVRPEGRTASEAPGSPRDMDSLEEQSLAELEIEGEPDWMVAGYGSLWVLRDEAAAVDRIDPASNEVVATVEVGSHPCNGTVAAFGSIWVPSCGENVLQRISAKAERVEATIDVRVYQSFKGTAPSGGIAAGHGSVWMITKGDGRDFDVLARIDPRTNEVMDRIDLGHFGGGIAVDDSSVWVTAPDEGLLLRVDPGSGEVVAEIDGLVQPTFVAAGEGALWVLSGTWDGHPEGDGSVTRVDPATNEIAARIKIDETTGSPGAIEAGEGFVWARSSFTVLAKIDPASNEVVEQYRNEKGNGDVALGFGFVWLSDFAFNVVWRVPL
jgi:virginiamycin B lyase